MIDKPAHVTDEAAALLDADTEARIHYILSKPWVHYPKANFVSCALSEFRCYY